MQNYLGDNFRNRLCLCQRQGLGSAWWLSAQFQLLESQQHAELSRARCQSGSSGELVGTEHGHRDNSITAQFPGKAFN